MNEPLEQPRPPVTGGLTSSAVRVPGPAAGPAPIPLDRPTPVVDLRVPTEEDAYAWREVFDDPEVMEFFGGRSAEPSVYLELTARQRRHHAELGYCLYTLTDPLDGSVVGFTGAQPWPREWGPVGEVEIGWRLARRYWGRGYATAAARLALESVRTAGVPEVVAMVDTRNERSLAVCRRLGMREAETYARPGTEATSVCYRLTL
ncbi:GNAT family N-acetyltransferase [Streptomyces sp. NPDC059740]|uniref:GNAT family N-acetyltransferase n=1 Tax=Streptomyces sp. NPDC059740 TaxID=3346926 RepID=UPI003648C6EB